MSTSENSPNETLVDTLKRVDPDRYRAALLAGEQARARLMTLYAFHYELSKVPEWVSEPMVGAIRYQWWRDAVEEIYSGKAVRKHEVTTPLSSVLTETGVSRFWVDQLIDGRERDLDPRPFEDLDAAKDYCAQTSGKLIQIAVQVAAPDIRLSAQQTDGVSAAGLAWGLTGLARAYGYYHNTMLSKIAFADMVTAAGQAHSEARSALGKVPPALNPALSYAALIPLFAARLTSTRHDPKLHQVTLGPLRKQLALMGAAMRGRL